MATRTRMPRVMTNVEQAEKMLTVLSRNRLIYSFHVMYICFIFPAIMRALPIYLKFYRKINSLRQKYNVDREIRYWRSNKEELLKVGQRGYRLKIEDFGLDQENLELLKENQQQSHEVVVADIDQDGFLLSYFGPIRNAPTIPKEQFLVRTRFNLKVVAINGCIGVKKGYNDNKLRFVNEIKVLHNLGLAGCNVPAIMDVDFDNLTLTFSYISGPVLREELAQRGAALRDRELRSNSDYLRLTRRERRIDRAREGRQVLYEVVDSQFIERLFTELNKIHASRVADNDIKYGNVIIDNKFGQPYWIDFERASYYPNLGDHSFRLLCDLDIERFNLLFSTEKLTYKNIKSRIKSKNVPAINDWDAPVYFGSGLRIGSIWNVEAGYGHWHYFLKHHLPSLSGKRILQLGANNAFNAMQMLRHGAREVIGIELDSKYIAQGNFVREAFEWADSTRYNFSYIQADIREVPIMNLGKFDIIIALCSSFCLDDDAILDLIPYISSLTDIFVMQLDNTTSNRVLLEYARQALSCNGFPVTRVIAPRRYSRPLVIGSQE